MDNVKYREGKVNVCHHIKGHIPLLVYPSFKPCQLYIPLPRFVLATATPYGMKLEEILPHYANIPNGIEPPMQHHI